MVRQCWPSTFIDSSPSRKVLPRKETGGKGAAGCEPAADAAMCGAFSPGTLHADRLRGRIQQSRPGARASADLRRMDARCRRLSRRGGGGTPRRARHPLRRDRAPDYRPLISTAMNADLRLDKEEARRVSPLYWTAPSGRTFDAVVGALESNEFLRQSRIVADAWGKAGVATRYEAVPQTNHFTVLDPLTDANS